MTPPPGTLADPANTASAQPTHPGPVNGQTDHFPQTNGRLYVNTQHQATQGTKRLLAIIDNDLSQLVETITVFGNYRHPNLDVDILCPAELYPLAAGCDVFTLVRPYETDEFWPLFSVLNKKKYAGLYYPGRRMPIWTLSWVKGLSPASKKPSWLWPIEQILHQKPSPGAGLEELAEMGFRPHQTGGASGPKSPTVKMTPDFSLADKDWTRVDRLLASLAPHPIVVIEPFSSDGSQVWPPKLADKFIGHLLERTSAAVIIIDEPKAAQKRTLFQSAVNLIPARREKLEELKTLRRFRLRWQELAARRPGRVQYVRSRNIITKARLYSAASIFVGSLSPELMLAKLMRTPVLAFTDLLFHKEHQLDLNRDNIIYLRPEYLQCIGDCKKCDHPGCISYISPERALAAIADRLPVVNSGQEPCA